MFEDEEENIPLFGEEPAQVIIINEDNEEVKDEPLASAPAQPICSEDIILSDKQKTFILQYYDKMFVDKLAQKVFNDDTIKPSSFYVVAIKKFLAEHNINPKTKSATAPQLEEKKFELSEEHKLFIDNNCRLMKPSEVFKTLFPSEPYSASNPKFTQIYAYFKTLSFKQDGVLKTESGGKYMPPTTQVELIRKINNYTGSTWDLKKLEYKHKEQLKALGRFLNFTRFVAEMNNLNSMEDKELFESQFVAHTFDKPDLTADDLNPYVNLCLEYIIQKNVQKEMEILREKLKEITDDPDGRIAISLVEAINTKSKEYDECVKRQKSLQKDLSGSRANRIDKNIQENQSVLSLVEAWKNAEERERMIQIAERRKMLVKETVDKIENEEEFIIRVLGLSKDEALHG